MKSELTQIREGNRRVHNWRIVAGVLVLLCLYVLLGKLDSDARLAEAERLASLHATHTQAVRPDPSASSGLKAEVEGQAKPLQRLASINQRIGGGVL